MWKFRTMGIENKSFDFKRHLTLVELDYGFNWQLAWSIPHQTAPRKGCQNTMSPERNCILDWTLSGKFQKIFFALSEKLLWWVGDPDGRGSLQGMLIRRMKRKQMEKVEERKMGWWEETGKEKERGAGQLDISWVYFGLIIAELIFHSNIDLLAPFSGI